MENSPTAAPFLLSLLLGNWRAFQSLLETFCITMGGAAGLQILQGKKIPLRPFIVCPDRNDFESNASGSINELTYEHVGSDGEGLTATQLFDLPLSATGKSNLRKDIAIYEAALAARIVVDNKLLQFLYLHMSKDAMSAIKAHADYPAYFAEAEGFRSYPFYIIIQKIHQVGNATTKLRRLIEFIQVQQGDLTHEAYLSVFNDYKILVAADLASPEHPDHIHMDTLFCLIYLAGLNAELFGPILDQLLSNNPSEIFANLADLQSKVQIWKSSRQISMSDSRNVSTQGQAFFTPTLHPAPCPYYSPSPSALYSPSFLPLPDSPSLTVHFNIPGSLPANQRFQTAKALRNCIRSFVSVALADPSPSDADYNTQFSNLLAQCEE